MEEKIRALKEQLEADAAGVRSKEELSAFWQKYLGKNGSVAGLMKGLRDVPKEERPAAGKTIICEKPIGLSLKEAEGMYAAAEKAGVLFEVHQNRRWDDDFLTVKKIFESEGIGGDY